MGSGRPSGALSPATEKPPTAALVCCGSPGAFETLGGRGSGQYSSPIGSSFGLGEADSTKRSEKVLGLVYVLVWFIIWYCSWKTLVSNEIC